MRAKEFLSEQEMHPYDEKRLGNIMIIPELDQFYDFYRFMIAVAQSPEQMKEFNKETWIRRPTAVTYTQEDEEILKRGLKALGKSGKWLTNDNAHEPDDTHATSPVAKVKKNKYGI
jgi:hypothetical protein